MTEEQLETRDYTFCSAIYTDLTSRQFLIGTPSKHEAINRAHAFAAARWGKPHHLNVYPRNYIREARRLFAAGLHD